MSDNNFQDNDPQEIEEWVNAFNAVLQIEGATKAEGLLNNLLLNARRKGLHTPFSSNTPYLNTIAQDKQVAASGDYYLERKIRSLIRWNATAMVVKANKESSELGGHIATFASSATLYEVGFNHFWRATNDNQLGDLIYFQGHASPGIYARAFLEGRISALQLDNFRREVSGQGLSSYPHPWLMKDFWQFPTVSMGLGPIMAIYQARFMKYLNDRNLVPLQNRKVWAFLGDGECDEPESLGAISLAGRERLDNLVFVINCNLQRLDGPVRGNGKIIQELERVFRGAGWNVIKVIWGSKWDPLINSDSDGLLLKRMEEAVDGDYQNYKSQDGAFVRDNFFGKYSELKARVSHMTDSEIWGLNRGGHDPHKVFAAYQSAVQHQGQPTVILAKTVKGYGMGSAGEGQNRTHQQKKMDFNDLVKFRDRFDIPLTDEQVKNLEYCKPQDQTPEMQYLFERRRVLGGFLPTRTTKKKIFTLPPIEVFSPFFESTGEKELSTTMVFVRILTALLRDKSISQEIVPIIPDEARTFGMEGLFRQLGIYSSVGQLYTPQDKDQIMYYREDLAGQILEEGICEAGAMSSWIAAATAYSTHHHPMIPFYIFYSMFGMQRIGDLVWASGDMRSRGFLIGGTAGKTTLAGEGLQHQDGHSHLLSSAVPNCHSYDPAFSYELAIILQHGLRQMLINNLDHFYYITVMNENYRHPSKPTQPAIDEHIIKGIYSYQKGTNDIHLIGSGAILNEVIRASDILRKEFNLSASIYSAPSISEAVREAQDCARYNLLNPELDKKISHLSTIFSNQRGIIVSASDYVKAHSEQMREFLPLPYYSLGTDGFGRSDTRASLRDFFEVNRYYIAYYTLAVLAQQGQFPQSELLRARTLLKIDSQRINPIKR
ncbi:MAG: pyruvate dehydrogenase (acetyl-transferring), homodimeric type [Methylacidiphilales bacterium]|nr:pyruvate dehydrogenase (acetyl-transferring), homodimeric type [Candidatus Methylacidiphilales bacterium]